LDNDGDLDLFVNQIIGNAAIPFLFLNNGNGRFIDGTEPSGIRHGGYLALADYNRDGFLDMFATDGPAKDKTLYRNDGNDNHWLIVEPIGVASNRQGIGARLTATADKLQQMREVFGGGNGFNQSESQVHFGLGVQLQVDQLEIRWPSGQVDLLEDIAADQYIRVIEGRGAYFTVQPTVWDVVPPDMLFVDGPALLNAAVRPARFEPEAQIVRVSADLRGLGGEQNVPLNETAAGLYALQDVLLELGPAVGLWTLDILIEQETSLGPYWSRLTRELTIVPAADQVIFGAPEKTQWSDSNEIEAETFAGHRALRLQNRQAPFYKPEAPVPIAGYTAFRFLFYPGEIEAATTNRIQVSINGKRTNIFPLSDFAMTLDLEQAQWQEVIVPLDSFGLNPGDAIESIFFTINLKGEAHLAEIRLLRQQPSLNTAVVEDQTDTEPQSFDLEQNYPNPFNSGTVIRFALPVSEQIELALYNLAGQKVQTLVQGQRPAGAYTVRWDGRDADGRALASGMYFYRLSANGKSTIRKLLLLR
jgi:hypothetical protein